jgi:DNA-binding transcriptional MerR regulator
MALNTNKNLKLYYSIKEVAGMIGVPESMLRYWETEFPDIKPKAAGNKVRRYTEGDIEKIKIIYNLVKVRGFKIAAARKMLHANRHGVEKSAEVMESLISLRDQLQELRKQLDHIV